MDKEQSIPRFLVEMLEEQYGQELTNRILQGYEAKRKTTFRINTLKASKEEIKEVLEKENIVYKEVSWYQDAIILLETGENDIAKLKIYEEGKIYLQSLSSMLPPIFLEPKEGENILDMAAAPGSKTTQIAAMTNNKAMITACEMNRVRSERLKYNLEKQGVTSCYMMLTDARRLNDFFSFDRILLDAPCSGSGTLTAFNEKLDRVFTLKLIQKSVEVQVALLKKAIRLLKSGKEMIYSTCSILASENEQVLEKALKGTNAEIVPIELEQELKGNEENGLENLSLLPVKIPGTICVCPNELFEGFFIAKIRKK